MVEARTAPAPADDAPHRETLYLVDGSGYIFRAYFAIPPPLTRSDGTADQRRHFGFSNMMA